MSATALRLGPAVLDRVLTQVRSCGAGRNECVLYVTAALSAPNEALDVIHPAHEASPVSADVDGTELQRVWSWLRARGQRVVLQVHTHPGGAHHSGIDDEYPVVHSVGFRSLVLAQFGAHGLRGAHLAIYQGAGRWRPIPREGWAEHLLVEGVLQVRGNDGSQEAARPVA